MLSKAKHPRMRTSTECLGKKDGLLCPSNFIVDAQPEIPGWLKDSQRSAQNDRCWVWKRSLGCWVSLEYVLLFYNTSEANVCRAEDKLK